MKLLLPLLLAPTLALAAATGSVTLLDGTPVSGAVIKSLTDSVFTTASGTFALGRTSGISPRFAKSTPVTSHLTVENGRPRLTFAGMDIAGRTRSSATARQNLSRTGSSFAARSTGTPDTLKVYWKGKRLTVLPVTSDTTVTFRIDTAWKDDAGIPWNPSITYGSLFDSRDGQTYRTVTIGSQTWMAENLNFAWGDASALHCSEMINNTDTLRACGSSPSRLYTWPQAMGIDTSYSHLLWSGSSLQGICPIGWHVPTNPEWSSMFPVDLDTVMIANGGTYTVEANFSAGEWLKSSTGWAFPGNDKFGYRVLPITFFRTINSKRAEIGSFGYLWSSSQNPNYAQAAGLQIVYDTISSTSRMNAYPKTSVASLRCLKD